MQSRRLLDCTLRDGGYVNDWNFGRGNIACIFNRLCEANVDYVEIGFLDSRRAFDPDRTIQPDTQSMCRVFEGTDRRGTKVVAMIDYGTCPLENLQPRDETFIDAIRLIFKKDKADGALEFAKGVKAKGYDVFLQMVSITSYSDREMLDFIEKAGKVEPYAVSIVDTYGLLHSEGLMHYFDILDRNLPEGVAIGYHSHNNFQLGYSNSISFLKSVTDRELLVDGTLYGMGKSAGNAPLELLSMHMDETYGADYSIGSLLEVIDNNIMNIYRKRPWGYNYVFFISARNDCHPNYVNYLLEKNTLSASSVDKILSGIPKENKLTYSEDVIRRLYLEYQGKGADDSESVSRLRPLIENKVLLLLGPGPSMSEKKDEIDGFIAREDPLKISVNSVIDGADLVFLTSSKRYSMIYPDFNRVSERVVATSNITSVGSPFGYMVNYGRIRPFGDSMVSDNSLILLLELLVDLCPDKVYLAGFDGFSGSGKDYFDDRMSIRVKDDADRFNREMSKEISKRGDLLDIEFLTPSLYDRKGTGKTVKGVIQ